MRRVLLLSVVEVNGRNEPAPSIIVIITLSIYNGVHMVFIFEINSQFGPGGENQHFAEWPACGAK
jgi:hypothetical protein